MKTLQKSSCKNFFPWGWSLGTIAFVLFVWWMVTRAGLVRPLFLPSPHETFSALFDLLSSGRFAKALLVSFARIAGATFLAVVAGGAVGALMGTSKTADHLLSPITQPLRYIPVTALVPLLLLWFGIGEVMKITFLFIGIVFYFIPLVRNAVRSVPQEYVDVARTFSARWWFIVKRVYWPHALPQIFDGLIVINGIGWTYVILAEIVNAKDGLGYLIYIAGRLQRSDEVFAGLVLVALVAIASDRILHRIRTTFFFW